MAVRKRDKSSGSCKSLWSCKQLLFHTLEAATNFDKEHSRSRSLFRRGAKVCTPTCASFVSCRTELICMLFSLCSTLVCEPNTEYATPQACESVEKFSIITSEVTGDCIPTTALTQWLQLRGRWVADSGIGCSMPVPEEAVQRIFRHDATRPQGAGESCKTLCGNTASSKECQAGPRRVNLVTRNSRSTRTGHGRNVQFHHWRGNSSDHRFSTGSL